MSANMNYNTAIGDILLVAGNAKQSKGLITAQKLLYPKARSSHVAINLGGGAFIHSTTDKGVHLAFLPEILKGCSSQWRAIRLRSVTVEQERLLLAGSNHYLAQSYNKGYMMPGNETSSFCSELAVKTYAKAGIPILGGREPNKTAPAHFDEQADILTDWVDVSADYRTLLKYIEVEPELSYLEFCCIVSRLESVRRTNAKTELLFGLVSDLFPSEGMTRAIEEMKQQLDKAKLFSYWDIPSTQPASQKSEEGVQGSTAKTQD